MSSQEHWYSVHLGDGEGQHVGYYRVVADRDGEGHRILRYEIAFLGKVDGQELAHEAKCRVVLERKDGRFVPLEVAYEEPSRNAELKFVDGHLEARGDASGHDGSSLPADIIPSYAISMLAEEIFDQAEASVVFSAIVEGTGAICATEAKLVAMGKSKDTPFATEQELWRVDWLSHEGHKTQSFYFTDEGLLSQVDWGGSKARLADDREDAIPPEFSISRFMQDHRDE